MARRSAPVKRIQLDPLKLQERCKHGILLRNCVHCMLAEARQIDRRLNLPAFTSPGGEFDLEKVIAEAVRYMAAVSVIQELDRGFWLTNVEDKVFAIRPARMFAKQMFGVAGPPFDGMAVRHIHELVVKRLRVRDEYGVRVYVCWRVPSSRPRRWGALHHLRVDQVELVARDYGVLGDGVAWSKNAALYLVDMMRMKGPNATVADIWPDAIPRLQEIQALRQVAL